MSQPIVIVTEAEPVEPAPTVVVETGPAYVTAGELDARMQLLETNIGERVSAAFDAAYEARAAAEAAADQAAVATMVAVDAAATADDSADGAGSADSGADDGADGDVDGAPQPPQKRAAPAPSRPAGTRSGGGYGAGFLSGR